MRDYLLILAGIFLAGFHSGSETGFYCVNRLRLRLWAERGRASARVLQRASRAWPSARCWSARTSASTWRPSSSPL